MQKVQNQKQKYQNRKRHVMTRYTIVARNFDLINRALYNEVNLLSCLALVIILPTGLINNQYPAARESRRGKMSVARESRRGKKKELTCSLSSFSFVWHEACEERIAAVKIDGGEEER